MYDRSHICTLSANKHYYSTVAEPAFWYWRRNAPKMNRQNKICGILCRCKGYACRLACTDKFPDVSTRLRKSIMGEAPNPPPPPGYASVLREIYISYK